MGMVPLKCPGCGANIELDDSREFGFCNFCGTKVMQDKIVVEHQGSVKVDNSEYVEKFLQNARRAKEKEDWEETEKYYNLVEQNDPTNIEAIFYSSYGKAKMSLVNDDIYKRQQYFKVLTNCVSIIDDNYDVSKSESNQPIVESIAKDINGMLFSDFVFTQWKNGYGVVTRTNKDQTYTLFLLLSITFVETINNIIAKDDQVYLHKILINHYTLLMAASYINNDAKKDYREKIISEQNKIKELDSSYEIPEVPKLPEASNSGGCYVATAVYGSYDCPQVWTLRRYRDNQLASTWYGRAFIHTYYAISPTIVKWFGDTQWFKLLWKDKLDRMVSRLNSEGVENTPYNDIEW